MSISYELHFWRQFTTKWRLVFIQNGMSNVTIIQFGHQNARSGRNRVFPIRIPINTIWSGWSFLGHHSCKKSSTSPSRDRLSMLELDVPFWILLELLCLRMSKSFLLESRRWSKDVVFHCEFRIPCQQNGLPNLNKSTRHIHTIWWKVPRHGYKRNDRENPL